MPKIFQCVPNFSEGRRAEVLEAIVNAIDNASSVRVVDSSMDFDHNRAVVTFIGGADDVRAAMLAGARIAVNLIDLNNHSGGHPRIGAIDVVPVVPIADSTMDDAIALGHAIGEDFARELSIPVYYYEDCALRGHCANLSNIRKGGYEGLMESGLTGDRAPDVGPSRMHPTAGASVVGARGPLIAYNVNLASNNIIAARDIAAKIRDIRDRGEGFIGVKAIGVFLRSRGIAQVSTNITRPDLVSVYDVYSFIEREARGMGVEVLESELIGAMRESALIDVARAALKLPDLSDKRILDRWID